MVELTEQQVQALERPEAIPPLPVNPKTPPRFVLLPEEEYERLTRYGADPWTDEQRDQFRAEALDGLAWEGMEPYQDDRPAEATNSPVFLLREQAQQLQQKTTGLVLAGLLLASAPDGSFWVGFDLYSPALGEYTYHLFEVTYPPEFFPVTLTTASEEKAAQTADQFKTLLESVLRSSRTEQVVEAIMAQATALGPVEAGK
ncbi:MAG TPA: hypothetical protein VFW33_17865 [Gemmataceae bacterium]|nr:hypothetical protein [Gemmataceae bacterium]